MITGKLPHLARETHAAISQKNFGLADPAGVDDHLSGRREACVIFVGQTKIEIAKWNPNTFAAPAHMDDLVYIGQEFAEGSNRFWCGSSLKTSLEHVFVDCDAEAVHAMCFRQALSRLERTSSRIRAAISASRASTVSRGE